MSNSNEFAGLRAEVSRVKALKRNVEAALELVRSDSEKGKIHLRVSDDADFRRKVAEAIVKESHPAGLDGGYYADPVMGKVYFQDRGACPPWNQNVNWRIVSVGELVNQEKNDFSGEIDWEIADIHYRETLSAEGEEREWIEKAEKETNALAIAFALSEILDEIIVEPFAD